MLLNLLVKPASLLVESITHNQVSHDDWATYTSLFSLGFVFCALSDLGINQFLTKTIASDTNNFKKEYPFLFSIKLVLSVLFPFSMLLVGKLMGYTANELLFLFWLSFSHGLIQLISFFRSSLQGFQLFKQDAYAANFDKLFFIGFLLVLYFTHATTIEGVIHARILSLLVTLLLLFFLLKAKQAWLNPVLPTKNTTKLLLSNALPFAFITILYSMNEKIDQVMIERLALDRSEASIYAAAYRWLDAAMMYLWIVLPLFFARFSYRELNKTDKQQLLTIGLGITSTPLIVVSIYSLFYGDTLFQLFSNSNQTEIALMTQCFAILSIALLLQGCFAILSTYLTANNETKSVSILLTLSIALNISLNYYFIPSYGALAAAYTTLLSTLFLSLGYVFLFLQKKIFTLPYQSWSKIILIFTCTYAIAYYLHSIHTQWFVFLPVIGTIVLASAFATKLIDLSALKKVNA